MYVTVEIPIELTVVVERLEDVVKLVTTVDVLEVTDVVVVEVVVETVVICTGTEKNALAESPLGLPVTVISERPCGAATATVKEA